LPTDATVIFVRAGEPPGGTGTRDAPMGSLAAALGAARSGTVIALSRGTFEGPFELPGGTTLWGACVSGTIVSRATPGSLPVTLYADGRGVTVRNLQLTGDGPGIMVGTGNSLDLVDVLVTGTTIFGVGSAGGTLTGRNIVVRGTRVDQEPDYAGTAGWAVDAEVRAQIDLTRVVFEGNASAAVIAYDAGTVVRLTDAALRNTQSDAFGNFGEALWVEAGARIEVERGVFEGNIESGVMAFGAAAAVQLTDVVIRDSRARLGDHGGGAGLWLEGGAQGSLSRVAVLTSESSGVLAYDTATALRLENVVVADTRGGVAECAIGRGIEAIDGATLEASRTVVASNRGAGVFLADSTARLADFVVADTASESATGQYGVGIAAQEDAVLELTRGVIERNRYVGLYLSGSATSAVLADVIVRGTTEADCAADACAGTGGGFGLTVLGAAHAGVQRFVVADNALCGIQLAYGADPRTGEPNPVGGTVDLQEGEVFGSPVGVNVQTEGFDLARLTDRVAYRDNGINLDTATLPVPDSRPPCPH
jgi:hypothetical protein